MECNCGSKMWAIKWIVAGIIIILARWMFPSWDIWIVIGILMILKAVSKMMMPGCGCCGCETETKTKKRK